MWRSRSRANRITSMAMSRWMPWSRSIWPLGVRQRDEARVDRRLALVDVEPRTGDLPGVQRVHERRFIDDWPARRVDEDCRMLHLSKLLRAEQVVRLLCQRHVHRHEVRLDQQSRQVDTLRAKLLLGFSSQRIRIVVKHAHVEALGAVCDPAPDATYADDAKRGAVDVGAEHHVDRPASELALAGE